MNKIINDNNPNGDILYPEFNTDIEKVKAALG